MELCKMVARIYLKDFDKISTTNKFLAKGVENEK
jgi:hypothetical protein